MEKMERKGGGKLMKDNAEEENNSRMERREWRGRNYREEGKFSRRKNKGKKFSKE